MTALRSLLFNIFFFAGFTVFLLSVWVLVPFPPDVLRTVVVWWSKVIGGALRVIAGVDCEFRGTENLPPPPAVIASKHQSAFDTICYLWLKPFPMYVMKKELLSIPFWGWYANRCGKVAVDRRGGAGALKKMVRESLVALDDGKYLVVFPEGTRVAPGDKKPYHPGIAAIYAAAKAPLVPVALNSGVFWGRRKFLKRPGTIVVEYLPPIPPGLDRKAFIAELESRIEEATNRLVAEGRDKAG